MLKTPKPPHGVGLLFNHGTLTVDAAQLRQIIGLAFGIQRVLVRGCPDWCDEDQIDIVAKTPSPDTTRDQMKEMLQTLLAERFSLVAHRETKPVSGYELILGKKGALLETAKDQPGPANVFSPNSTGMVFRNMDFVGLVNYLANVLGQPVKNMTGLTGRYNFALEFRPQDAAAPSPAGANPLPRADEFSSIVFAAVEEQLGLKLQPRQIPTDVLIVDRVQHPTEN
jgi:uncharacterized protein (TIGR03435 family)